MNANKTLKIRKLAAEIHADRKQLADMLATDSAVAHTEYALEGIVDADGRWGGMGYDQLFAGVVAELKLLRRF